MNWSDTQAWLAAIANSVFELGANWFIQSTLLLALGLTIGWTLRSFGAAIQSLVYRTTLLAVLASPLVTLGLAKSSLSSWGIKITSWQSDNIPLDPPSNKAVGGAGNLASTASASQSTPVTTNRGSWEEAEREVDSPGRRVAHSDWRSTLESGAMRAAAQTSPHLDTSNNRRSHWAHRTKYVAPAVSLIWFTTWLVLIGRVIWGWLQLRGLRGKAHSTDQRTLELGSEVARQMNVSPPRILRSPFLSSPCLTGVRRPAILLPDDENVGSLREVLIHEMAHLRRNDCSWKLLCHLATAILFYQPLLWMLARRLEVVAEEVCDDIVLEFGGDREQYANRLVDIAELNSLPVSMASVGIVSLRSILKRRVARVMDTSRHLSTRTGRAVSTTVLVGGVLGVAICGLVGIAPRQMAVQAQEPVDDALDEVGRSESEEAAAATRSMTTVVSGRVSDAGGTPVPNALVAAFGSPKNPGEDDVRDNFALAEGETDAQGNYRLELTEVNSRTHIGGFLIARKPGKAMAWKQLNFDDRSAELSLSMENEVPIRGRLVDLEGQPAAGVELRITSVCKSTPNRQPSVFAPFGFEKAPTAWLPKIQSDPTGRFVVHGVANGFGVRLRVAEGDRFAVQGLSINTGEPEERRHEQSYHQLVRNVSQGEEALLPIAPAQILEGTVTYEDSGLPVPFAQVEVTCRQHEYGSGRVVVGKTNENGEYRISAMPGSYFGVMAIPPSGEPYLARKPSLENSIVWQDGDVSRRADITLPRGVLVQGTIVEAKSGRPVVGAVIQYEPERANNPNTSDDVATGSRTRRFSDESGRVEISVLPGPGRLLVHAPDGKFVSTVFGSRELVFGKPGGMRQFVHGWKRINPPKDADVLEVTVQLELGSKAHGRLIDESGAPIEKARVISRLNMGSSLTRDWGYIPNLLGGQFEFSSLNAGEIYPVHFLDPKRRLGATVPLQAGTEQQTVVLRTCGEARARIVDEEGRPRTGVQVAMELVVTPGPHRVERAAAQRGELYGISAYMQMLDSTNYIPPPKSDENGLITFPALIPGAPYRILTFENQTIPQVQAEFSVEAGQSLDLGDLQIPKGSQTYSIR